MGQGHTHGDMGQGRGGQGDERSCRKRKMLMGGVDMSMPPESGLERQPPSEKPPELPQTPELKALLDKQRTQDDIEPNGDNLHVEQPGGKVEPPVGGVAGLDAMLLETMAGKTMKRPACAKDAKKHKGDTTIERYIVDKPPKMPEEACKPFFIGDCKVYHCPGSSSWRVLPKPDVYANDIKFKWGLDPKKAFSTKGEEGGSREPWTCRSMSGPTLGAPASRSESERAIETLQLP